MTMNYTKLDSLFSIKQCDKLFFIKLPNEFHICSWAIQNGGFKKLRKVCWLEVSNSELRPDVDPIDLVQRKVNSTDFEQSTIMLTSHPVTNYVYRSYKEEKLRVSVIATVGMSNAVAIGEKPQFERQCSTINILCSISSSIQQPAFYEALALISEARTSACLEANIKSPYTGTLSTGTGTDCVAFAANLEDKGLLYTGKHTLTGYLIGKTVKEAVSVGLKSWKKSNGC